MTLCLGVSTQCSSQLGASVGADTCHQRTCHALTAKIMGWTGLPRQSGGGLDFSRLNI
jgi:hypothetical protein